MVTRRAFLRTTGGLAGTLVTGGWPRTASADPVQSIQSLIDDYAGSSLRSQRANVGVVAVPTVNIALTPASRAR